MRKTLIVVGVLACAALTAPAAYATTPTVPVLGDCPRGWYVNEPDEAHRKPTPTKDGLEFKGNQLIHRETTGLSTKDLKPGTFVASPMPDQESFFSVEVNSGPGTYATLRWNATTAKWEMTTGGQFYTDADPDKLVDLPPVKKSHQVVSFGVGYTNSPPGTVTTVVSSVSFRGFTYDLTCQPKPEPTTSSSSPTPSPSVSTSTSASPSASASTSTSVSPSASSSTSVSPSATVTSSSAPVVTTAPGAGGGSGSAGGGLPVTGPDGMVIAGGAVALLAGGVILLVAVRRRRTRFTA
ncbi:hypothetical protein [Paractinoplanes maris]|uniref:hypothetical protein n=1 Tax=Paractinoplanes maris TaxID=1734446 RepID=UPI002021A0AD|nr:hypothetical protein [Actinoplanes maris]